jgi:hypothetical protein
LLPWSDSLPKILSLFAILNGYFDLCPASYIDLASMTPENKNLNSCFAKCQENNPLTNGHRVVGRSVKPGVVLVSER